MNNRRKQLMLASAREYCKCVVEGKTLRYNQWLVNANFSNGTDRWYGRFGSVSTSNNVLTYTATEIGANDYTNIAYQVIHSSGSDLTVGHKYLLIGYIKPNVSAKIQIYCTQCYDIATNRSTTIPANIWSLAYAFVTAGTNNYANFQIGIDMRTMQVGDSYQIRNCYLIDLTELGLDSITTTDQFFATDLGKYIAKGNYLPYETEGKFINARSPIYFDGRNAFNGKLELGALSAVGGNNSTSSNAIRSKDYIRVMGGQTYTFVSPNSNWAGIFAYDKNKNCINLSGQNNFDYYPLNNGNGSITLPNNARYVRFYKVGTDTNLKIAFNLGSNNKYEPYCSTKALEDIFAFDEQYYTGISSDFMTKKGIKYKTYNVEEITYNNLIPTNPDYLNDDTDSASANIVIHGTNGGTYWSENLTNLGFYSDIFESNTTEFVDIYMSGNNTNLYFATNVQMTSGHKYYISFNVLGNNPSNVNGLKIANLRLVDLTLLGLTDLTDKLRIFLNKNYRLPFNLTNKTIKDQVTTSHKEIDLSSLTWTYNTYQSCWESDISGKNLKSYSDNVVPNAIAEKYRVVSSSSTKEENDLWLYGRKPIIRIKSSDSQTTPSGKAFLELQTTELGIWLHININDYNWWVSAGTEIYKLSIDFDTLGWNVLDIFSLYGKNQGSVIFLRDEYDYCFENGYIYVKTPDIQDVWNFDLLISNAPTRMVSRRTINVESENEIDLDFTKE